MEVRKQTIRGLKWTGMEQVSIRIITFVIGVILARLLTPSDYGIIGILAVFMAISQTFIDSGFAQALIRKADLNDKDCCTVFYFNILISLVCYFVLFISAGLIADFFHIPELRSIIKVYCVTLFIGALQSVQICRMTVNLDFKLLAKVNILSSVMSGVIGVLLAYRGLGVWALVWQSILASLFHTIAIWYVSKWVPTFIFSKTSFKELFSFGSKLLAGGLFWQLYSNMIPILIGKFFTAKDLGFYNRGVSLAQLPSGTIMGMLEKVTYPILARIKDDSEHLISIYRKYIKCSSMVVMFVLILLAALAKPLIVILLTDKWLPSVVFLRIFIFAEMFDHIQKLNLNLLKVIGRSDYILKLEVYKRSISVLIIFISCYWGVIGVCASRVVITQISLIFNTYYTGKLFGLGYTAQIKDFMPYAILSLLSCLPTYLLTFSPLSNWIVILLGIMISPILYLLMLRCIKDDAYIEFVRPFIHKLTKNSFNIKL